MRLPLFLVPSMLAVEFSTALLSAEAVSQKTGDAEQESLLLHILELTEVDFGDRSVIYNRVAPPVLRERVRAPLPPAPTPDELAALEIEEATAEQDFQLLFISAVVYDGRVTELRWTENGREHRAFSNIDFHNLAGAEFESGGTTYFLSVAIDEATRASVAEWNREVDKMGWPLEMKANLPPPEDFPAGHSSYMPVPDESRALALAWNRYLAKTRAPPDEFLPVPNFPPAGTASAAECSVMDAIHEWFDTHESQLIAAREARKAAARERAEHLTANPPEPRDTIINFFPIRSSQRSPSK